MTKKCLVFETLGNVKNLQIQESSNDNEVRLSGVFGVCGIKNGNNRIYDKENYGKMVESLQKVIATEGCPGELEHPNTMNIDLNNVSHKIESIEMNEDGTITGTILLLDTPKGQVAKAIIKGGLPLYISSRGAGNIDESGHVTLSTIKTYDLVGTPGFSQAKLKLKSNQTLESLNESLDDGNIMYAIIEDGLLGDSDDKDKDKDKDEKKDDKKDEKSSDDNKEEKKDDENEEKPSDDDENNNKNKEDNTTMNEIKQSIDKLTEKVTQLEAELHVAQESLEAKDAEIQSLTERLDNVKETNYGAIETWVKEEFAPEFKNELIETVAENHDDINESIKNYVVEEFAPVFQNWVCEEFAPTVEGWITEEFAPTVEGWITEEFAPEQENKINENVNEFIEAQKAGKLDEIDALLETLSSDKDAALEIMKEEKAKDKYAGVYVVENMPAQYKPLWNGLNEERQAEILRTSKVYDFTKEGVLESFWDSVTFSNEGNAATQQVNENKDIRNNYYNNVVAQMNRFRGI